MARNAWTSSEIVLAFLAPLSGSPGALIAFATASAVGTLHPATLASGAGVSGSLGSGIVKGIFSAEGVSDAFLSEEEEEDFVQEIICALTPCPRGKESVLVGGSEARRLSAVEGSRERGPLRGRRLKDVLDVEFEVPLLGGTEQEEGELTDAELAAALFNKMADDVVLSAAVAELGAAFESLNFNDLRFFHGQRIPYKDDFDTEPIQLQGHGEPASLAGLVMAFPVSCALLFCMKRRRSVVADGDEQQSREQPRSGVDGEEPGRSSSGMNPMYRGSSAAVAGAEAMSSSSSGTSWVERTLSRKTSNPFLMSIGDGKLLPRGENMRVGEEKLDDRQGYAYSNPMFKSNPQNLPKAEAKSENIPRDMESIPVAPIGDLDLTDILGPTQARQGDRESRSPDVVRVIEEGADGSGSLSSTSSGSSSSSFRSSTASSIVTSSSFYDSSMSSSGSMSNSSLSSMGSSGGVAGRGGAAYGRAGGAGGGIGGISPLYEESVANSTPRSVGVQNDDPASSSAPPIVGKSVSKEATARGESDKTATDTVAGGESGRDVHGEVFDDVAPYAESLRGPSPSSVMMGDAPGGSPLASLGRTTDEMGRDDPPLGNESPLRGPSPSSVMTRDHVGGPPSVASLSEFSGISNIAPAKSSSRQGGIGVERGFRAYLGTEYNVGGVRGGTYGRREDTTVGPSPSSTIMAKDEYPGASYPIESSAPSSNNFGSLSDRPGGMYAADIMGDGSSASGTRGVFQGVWRGAFTETPAGESVTQQGDMVGNTARRSKESRASEGGVGSVRRVDAVTPEAGGAGLTEIGRDRVEAGARDVFAENDGRLEEARGRTPNVGSTLPKRKRSRRVTRPFQPLRADMSPGSSASSRSFWSFESGSLESVESENYEGTKNMTVWVPGFGLQRGVSQKGGLATANTGREAGGRRGSTGGVRDSSSAGGGGGGGAEREQLALLDAVRQHWSTLSMSENREPKRPRSDFLSAAAGISAMARTAASVSKKIGSNRPKSEGRQHHLGRGGAGTTGTLPQRAVVDRLGGTREESPTDGKKSGKSSEHSQLSSVEGLSLLDNDANNSNRPLVRQTSEQQIQDDGRRSMASHTLADSMKDSATADQQTRSTRREAKASPAASRRRHGPGNRVRSSTRSPSEERSSLGIPSVTSRRHTSRASRGGVLKSERSLGAAARRSTASPARSSSRSRPLPPEGQRVAAEKTPDAQNPATPTRPVMVVDYKPSSPPSSPAVMMSGMRPSPPISSPHTARSSAMKGPAPDDKDEVPKDPAGLSLSEILEAGAAESEVPRPPMSLESYRKYEAQRSLSFSDEGSSGSSELDFVRSQRLQESDSDAQQRHRFDGSSPGSLDESVFLSFQSRASQALGDADSSGRLQGAHVRDSNRQAGHRRGHGASGSTASHASASSSRYSDGRSDLDWRQKRFGKFRRDSSVSSASDSEFGSQMV